MKEKSAENNFRIDERVWKYRGLKKQEEDEKNSKIEKEIESRINEIRSEIEAKAYEEGLKKVDKISLVAKKKHIIVGCKTLRILLII